MKPASLLLILAALLITSPCEANLSLSVQPSRADVVAFPNGLLMRKRNAIIRVDKGTPLQRKVIIVKDDSAPAWLSEINIQSGKLLQPSGNINLTKDVMGLEVRFVLFDIWGQPLRTLSTSHLSPQLKQGFAYPIDKLGTWKTQPAEVGDFLNIVAFVASARMPNGAIWRADTTAISALLRKSAAKVTPEDLETR